MEKIVAIVLARGGSKGIQKKAIIPLCNRPLIYYCLDACVRTPEIDMVVAATDCPIIGKKLNTYRDYVKNHKHRIKVITDRDPNTATDTASSESGVLDTLNRLDEEYDIGLLVQATSPFTEPEDLGKLISLVQSGYDSAAFYTEDYSFSLDDDTALHPRVARQLRRPRRREAGNAWAFRMKGFKMLECRTFGKIGGQIINEPKHHEIDSWEDLDLAHYYMRSKNV